MGCNLQLYYQPATDTPTAKHTEEQTLTFYSPHKLFIKTKSKHDHYHASVCNLILFVFVKETWKIFAQLTTFFEILMNKSLTVLQGLFSRDSDLTSSNVRPSVS